MKISTYLLLGFVITILVGCNNKQKNNDNTVILGIWQNTTNPDASIEFTREGNYYLRFKGERILPDDSIAEKYSYDPLSKENNLRIFGNVKAGNTAGNLVVISPERIKISLVSQGTIVSEAEFTKVNVE
jgi:uncharacterized lipoprotein NlpE involved in copper resistance